MRIVSQIYREYKQKRLDKIPRKRIIKSRSQFERENLISLEGSRNMGKQPDMKEFHGMGGRCTVARAFGGVVEFDDKSLIVALTVAGHDGQKMIQTIGAEGSKAASFYRRFAESAHKVDGEGLTDFEREVFRAVVAHSFTAEEHEAYSDRWADDEEPIMDFQGEDFLS